MNYDSSLSNHGVVGEALPGVNIATQAAQRFAGWPPLPEWDRWDRESSLRRHPQRREAVAADLPGGLFQSALGGSVLLRNSIGQASVNSSGESFVSSFAGIFRRIADQGRVLQQRLNPPVVPSTMIEQTLSELVGEVAPASGAQFRISVMGKPKPLRKTLCEEISLIGREALLNAVRHSHATKIEVEFEYRSRSFRIVVRDNGRGMEPEDVVASRNSPCGLREMCKRARAFDAKFNVWSKRGLGTEVEVSFPA
jgi:signal transduction histidine kinase